MDSDNKVTSASFSIVNSVFLFANRYLTHITLLKFLADSKASFILCTPL